MAKPSGSSIRRIKEAMRSLVGPKAWTILGLVRYRAEDGLIELLARSFFIGVRWAPDRAIVRLREKLTLVRPLDHPSADLHLQVTSEIEIKYRLRSCEKEPETVEWLEQTFRAGDVLYDVGANVGAYSLLAARIGNGRAKVFAFEPGYRTFANLSDNIRTNALNDEVTALPIALSSRTGLAEFRYASLSAGGASHPGLRGVDRVGDTSDTSVGVMCATLDDLVELLELPLATHLKIDVDGAELEVLFGAKQVLECLTLRFVMIEIDGRWDNGSSIDGALVGTGFRLIRRTLHADNHTANCLYGRQESDAERSS